MMSRSAIARLSLADLPDGWRWHLVSPSVLAIASVAAIRFADVKFALEPPAVTH
ncbi:hypothetical protein [Oxynema sp. CENA135]|uniref:hypothetical protein n=1 Tax=Oxynema sp. CENA135 TaxID=984206 RepID=UPI001F33BA83|nr:hypothetical protein [Oxynema sp. CENA135]